MTEKQIIDAYCRIRKIDMTIPDDVLDFMKDAAIERINKIRHDNSSYAEYTDEQRLRDMKNGTTFGMIG